MSVDVNLLQFFSQYPIDKVLHTDTQVITNDGDTTTTGSSTGDATANITTTTLPNPLGINTFVRFVWSLDGVNFNSAESHILYSYTITLTDIPITSDPLQGLQAAVSIGVSDSSIIIQTGNGYHSNVSRLSTDPDTSGYTPISETFTIKYALYGIEPYGS